MNHLGDTNKMVGENMSNEQMTAQATPYEELRRQILSHCVPKNEREWWAAMAIERLEFELNAANDRIQRLEEFASIDANFAAQLERELNAANDRIKQLEEAGDALYEGWIGYGFTNDKHLAEWRKAKEAKP